MLFAFDISTDLFSIITQGGSFGLIAYGVIWFFTKIWPEHRQMIKEINEQWSNVVKEINEKWSNVVKELQEEHREERAELKQERAEIRSDLKGIK